MEFKPERLGFSLRTVKMPSKCDWPLALQHTRPFYVLLHHFYVALQSLVEVGHNLLMFGLYQSHLCPLPTCNDCRTSEGDDLTRDNVCWSYKWYVASHTSLLAARECAWPSPNTEYVRLLVLVVCCLKPATITCIGQTSSLLLNLE